MSSEGPEILRFPPKSQRPIVFDRRELSQIMSLYGRNVADGEWRDYAMDFGKDAARFDIHRRASEQPLYTIVKSPEQRDRGGLYSVMAPGGLIMRRGNDLEQVLRVLEKKQRYEVV